MARAVLKYAFVALLALLSAQAAVPFVRVVASIQILCSKGTEHADEKQTPQEARRIQANARVLQSAPAFVSRTRPEPDTAALFQRPPPLSFLFS
jgi:hypothetical protein